MTAFKARIVLSLFMGIVIALASAVAVPPAWAIDQDLTVQIKPGSGEGAGFGVVLWGETSHLTVTLTTPAPTITIVQPTKLRCSGDFIWNWTAIADTSATVDAYGIGRDDDHSIGFEGQYATTAPGGTGPNTFDVAIADVRIAGHNAEPTDDDALFIPPSDSGSPLDAGTMNVTVTLQASSDAPDPAGTLTLTWTNSEGIAFLTHNGVQINNGDSISVPKAGLLNEPIAIWTTDQFTSATIAATFDWDSTFVAQYATAQSAVDYVQVASSQYALEILDAQGFQPNITPGLGVDPAGPTIPGNWNRAGVFADGVSVLVIRPRPKNGMVPLNVTYSVEYVPIPAIGAVFPQNTAYVGSLSDLGNTAPSYGLPTLPAPDAGGGNTAVASPNAKVYYRPPNNFLFGRQGAQDLLIVARDIDGNVIGRCSISLIRPTMFLSHGFTSSPQAMAPMRNALAGRYDGHGGRSIRVLYLDWADINTAGYDHVPTRLVVDAPGRVRDNIYAEICANRAVGIAATRVDFVGHSMGGVIAKWYARDIGLTNQPRRNGFPNMNWNSPVATYLNRRANNFGIGDIRSLVTVGSPLRGSPIADRVSNMTFALAVLRIGQILGAAPNDINGLDDLGTQSTGTLFLSGQPAPVVSWFPIAGVGGPTLTEQALVPNPLLLQMLGLLPSQIDAILGPATSDFVVDRWSQVDRPPNGGTPGKWGLVHDVTHAQEMTNGLNFLAAPDSVGSYIAYALDLCFATPNDPGYQAGYNFFNPGF